MDPQNGIGIAIFDPDRNALRSGASGFPNPNQWGTDCLVGIYGTGCFFGIITDHVLRWRAGFVLEVTMKPDANGVIHPSFSADGTECIVHEDGGRGGMLAGETITAQTISVPQGAKLAVALYSPEDSISIESVW